MSADQAMAAPWALAFKASDWLERAGAMTRALFLVTAALSGALLYTVTNRPGTHPALIVTIIPQSPIAAAPPPAQMTTVAGRPDGVLAGGVVLEAVRAVSATSDMAVLAAAGPHAVASSATVAPVPVAASAATGGAGTAAPVGVARSITTAPASAQVGANPAAAPVPSAADLDGTNSSPRPPAAPLNQGQNRIGVPTTPVQSAPPVAAPVPAAGPGLNRITVPATQPPR